MTSVPPSHNPKRAVLLRSLGGQQPYGYEDTSRRSRRFKTNVMPQAYVMALLKVHNAALFTRPRRPPNKSIHVACRGVEKASKMIQRCNVQPMCNVCRGPCSMVNVHFAPEASAGECFLSKAFPCDTRPHLLPKRLWPRALHTQTFGPRLRHPTVASARTSHKRSAIDLHCHKKG